MPLAPPVAERPAALARPASPPRLRASIVAPRAIDAATLDAAFALFRAHYDGADRERFEHDLGEKQRVILLRDERGALRGFSTVLQREVRVGGRTVTMVFSGDTVIDRACWGQKRLQSAFAGLLLRLRLLHPRRPLYWFLISKGWRTYLLMANHFPRAVPRWDLPDPPELRAALDQLAAERFGAEYDAAAGIVRYATPHERVRDGVAPIDGALLANPHVRFFVQRNPGHDRGDELACLAQVRLRDLARVAAGIAWKRLSGTASR
ncbi:MAG TPA: hypothetical protein VFR37_03450 [Longimicrobium sp.]|nr:hypothetical protein [Longimicrobium sp.]